MPKQYTFPTLYDECKTVRIQRLKEWGYIKESSFNQFVISWYWNGDKRASVGARINTMNPEKMYLELDYTFNDEPVNYKIPLITIDSNLGKGKIWYFVCPVTHKPCRKLYHVGKYFLHRTAFIGCMYQSQTYSKKIRHAIPCIDAMFKMENSDFSKYRKHFKKFYRGKPTKKYLRCIRLEQMAQKGMLLYETLL